MQNYSVTRQIGIDAGHRLSKHGSKCRHFHGHRYEVKATCVAASGMLESRGEETGMVIDFGFLKEEMMDLIDAPCDHGMILSIGDLGALRMFAPTDADFDDWIQSLSDAVSTAGFALTENTALETKLYVIKDEPTAENLARHWFERLTPAVTSRTEGRAKLSRVTVMETPNCVAEYYI